MPLRSHTEADAIAARHELAEAIAREGGALALRYFRNRDTLSIDIKTNGQDVVSIADKEVEAHLRHRIAEAFPDDGVLGEEEGMKPGTSGFTWVMDPIDGTTPFVFGIPAWCLSIAVTRDRAIETGVIYDPVANELYSARRGEGATLNGQAIRVSTSHDLSTGVLGLGASHRVPSAQVAGVVERLLDSGGMFIRNGSGALMLAYVSAGRLAAYWEPHMNAWDCFAGFLLVEEAGGWAVDLHTEWGELINGGPVLAGAPNTEAQLRKLTE
ncbi:inositol monophosphatase [Mesorhizobium sp. RP14(2022)]|uniref:Inositol-1-monophosphatase n=1 Tax=Mesorhizobium liriopis TaxID=2953882 RepID=A0ABT1C7S5_9HYPH|nr:inositol monophosphatase [Mesorhizobium liriopis]MCO6050240.1 inositol monophosphatase [Mesorhizobium liriopis]